MAEDHGKATGGDGLTPEEREDLVVRVVRDGIWGYTASGGDPVGLALGVAKGGFGWFAERVREMFAAGLGREIADNAEELDEGFRGLARRMPPEQAMIDFHAFVGAWAKASERSVGRKKRILMAALQHSLRADQEEYERGLGLQILEVLEGLDYGDIAVLRQVIEHWEEAERFNQGQPGSKRRSPASQLRAADAWHGHRLHMAGLLNGSPPMSANGMNNVVATWFGLKVLEYVQGGLAEDIAKEEREAKE